MPEEVRTRRGRGLINLVRDVIGATNLGAADEGEDPTFLDKFTRGALSDAELSRRGNRQIADSLNKEGLSDTPENRQLMQIIAQANADRLQKLPELFDAQIHNFMNRATSSDMDRLMQLLNAEDSGGAEGSADGDSEKGFIGRGIDAIKNHFTGRDDPDSLVEFATNFLSTDEAPARGMSGARNLMALANRVGAVAEQVPEQVNTGAANASNTLTSSPLLKILNAPQPMDELHNMATGLQQLSGIPSDQIGQFLIKGLTGQMNEEFKPRKETK